MGEARASDGGNGPAKASDEDVREALDEAARELLKASRRLRAVQTERPKVQLFADEIADVRSRIRSECDVLESLSPAGE